jgi:hypothetical protein
MEIGTERLFFCVSGSESDEMQLYVNVAVVLRLRMSNERPSASMSGDDIFNPTSILFSRYRTKTIKRSRQDGCNYLK